jgi:hypothetical protein
MNCVKRIFKNRVFQRYTCDPPNYNKNHQNGGADDGNHN